MKILACSLGVPLVDYRHLSSARPPNPGTVRPSKTETQKSEIQPKETTLHASQYAEMTYDETRGLLTIKDKERHWLIPVQQIQWMAPE